MSTYMPSDSIFRWSLVRHYHCGGSHHYHGFDNHKYLSHVHRVPLSARRNPLPLHRTSLVSSPSNTFVVEKRTFSKIEPCEMQVPWSISNHKSVASARLSIDANTRSSSVRETCLVWSRHSNELIHRWSISVDSAELISFVTLDVSAAEIVRELNDIEVHRSSAERGSTTMRLTTNRVN